ncbi:hypothetical protein RvY_12712 [Ramazzottius varieornatus]|uniref:EF-hand domain-containing protein n=1 Tax=Ramazzottius varieornatus TaxID=947166 RepID=A0A1D1VQV6_RAMVA|nr:hypothetical protein RvY_12712 [Ramazzottius varieornatus]
MAKKKRSSKTVEKHSETVTKHRHGEKTRNAIEEKLGDGQITADEFVQIFHGYDRDGNGYLERSEVDNFLWDLLNSSLIGTSGKKLSPEDFAEVKAVFMSEFDSNNDGKISLDEMLGLLSDEESFYGSFRTEFDQQLSGQNYMKVWKKYDRDLSGFLERGEIKNFLRDLSQQSGKELNDKQLEHYTQQCVDLFDANNDGKLSMGELSRMLPHSENFVQLTLDKAFALHKLKQSDVDRLLDRYDRDGNGTLEGRELTDLIKDMLGIIQQGSFYNESDVFDVREAILKGCDRDGDGRINRKELAVILLTLANSGTYTDDASYTRAADSERIYQGRKSQHILSYIRVGGDRKTGQ